MYHTNRTVHVEKKTPTRMLETRINLSWYCMLHTDGRENTAMRNVMIWTCFILFLLLSDSSFLRANPHDSCLVTHHLLIIPYDIITDVTMTLTDSCLLTTYFIMTHTDRYCVICLFNTNILY